MKYIDLMEKLKFWTFTIVGTGVTGQTNAKPNKTNKIADTDIKKNSSVLAKTIAMVAYYFFQFHWYKLISIL